MKKTLLLAGVACLFAGAAKAEFNFKPYTGLDYNYSSIDMDKEGKQVIENKFHSGSVVLGARMHKNFGLEAFYMKSLKETKNSIFIGKTSSSLQGYGADLIGYLPLGCDGIVDVLGSVGAGQYELKIKNEGHTHGENSFGLRLGAGLQYNISDVWAVRGMYHYVFNQKSEIDGIDEFSLGVRYSF